MRNAVTNTNQSKRDLSVSHNPTDFRSLMNYFWNFMDSSNSELSELSPKIWRYLQTVIWASVVRKRTKSKKILKIIIFLKSRMVCLSVPYSCRGIWIMMQRLPIIITVCWRYLFRNLRQKSRSLRRLACLNHNLNKLHRTIAGCFITEWPVSFLKFLLILGAGIIIMRIW